jgi:hypothetical protein
MESEEGKRGSLHIGNGPDLVFDFGEHSRQSGIIFSFVTSG